MLLRNRLETTQAPAGGSAWVLPEMLSELASDGDADLVLDLIGAFASDTAPRLCSSRTAVMAGDRAALRAQAHSIKGSSRQMGATLLADICERLELGASDMPVQEMAGCIEVAEREFTNVCEAMHSFSPQLVELVRNPSKTAR